MMRRRLRWVSLVTALIYGATLLAPVVHAQVSESADFQAAPARSDGTRPTSAQEYVSDVQGRVSLRQELESRYSDAETRRAQAKAYLEQLKVVGTPAGYSTTQWEAYRQQEIKDLEAYLAQNDRNQNSIRERLGEVYSRLTQDMSFLKRSGNTQLSQELGPMIGTGGTAVVPIWSRPNPAAMIGARAQATRVTNLSNINQQIQTATSSRNATVSRASTTAAPTEGTWVTEVNAQGNVQLRNGERVVDLRESATTQSRNGNSIRNEEAFKKADYYRDLYQARSKIDTAKAKLEYAKSQAQDAKTIKELDTKIADLETKKSQLEGEIDEYNSKNPKKSGSTIGNLAASAAKWAAMSAGITVASNLVTQLTHNGWDPKNLDWQAAIAPLKTAEFWGGTAGSFAVSMVASMIPGGTFIKTLASIGGAAVGWQLGSGNLMNTDWKQLAVSTVGATLGTLLGSAIGGPIGGFIGGIAGQWAANWLMGKLQEYLEQQSSSYDPAPSTTTTETSVDPYTNLGNYTGSSRSGTTTSSGGDSANLSGDAVQIKAQLDKCYTELDMINRSDNPNRERIGQLQRQITQLQAQLRQLRAAGPTGER